MSSSSLAVPELSRRFGNHFVLITRAWRREADLRLAPLGLSHATASPLLLLWQLGDTARRQNELAQDLGIEQPSLVRLLDQLCAAALVERRADAGDRRAKILHLTPAGRRAAAAADRVLDELRADLLGATAPEDLQAAMRVLEGMWHRLGVKGGERL